MHHSRSTDRLELQKARSRADGLPDWMHKCVSAAPTTKTILLCH
jgi:hypothetical protein